jgi:hypothetical protein
MHPITLIGLSLVFFYSLTQILIFYGIDESTYGIYVLFYSFFEQRFLILDKK